MTKKTSEEKEWQEVYDTVRYIMETKDLCWARLEKDKVKDNFQNLSNVGAVTILDGRDSGGAVYPAGMYFAKI